MENLKKLKVKMVISLVSIGISMFAHPLQEFFEPMWFIGWMAAVLGWSVWFKPAMDLIKAIDESLEESDSEECE